MGLFSLFFIVVINLVEITLIIFTTITVKYFCGKVKLRILFATILSFLICSAGELSYFGFVCSSPYVSRPSVIDYCSVSLSFYGVFLMSILPIKIYMKGLKESDSI